VFGLEFLALFSQFGAFQLQPGYSETPPSIEGSFISSAPREQGRTVERLRRTFTLDFKSPQDRSSIDILKEEGYVCTRKAPSSTVQCIRSFDSPAVSSALDDTVTRAAPTDAIVFGPIQSEPEVLYSGSVYREWKWLQVIDVFGKAVVEEIRGIESQGKRKIWVPGLKLGFGLREDGNLDQSFWVRMGRENVTEEYWVLETLYRQSKMR
jgi:hypothetical protein